MNSQELEFILNSWEPVPGYEGLYEVHRIGKVRSLGFMTPAGYRKGRVLKPAMSAGYPAVSLVKGGVKKTVRLHQIVCEAFHGPAPSPKHEVAHVDGVRGHVWARNLRWATSKENQKDKKLHGTSMQGDKHHQTVIPDMLVPVIATEYVKGSSVYGLKALAKKYGCSIQPIHSIVTGKRMIAEVSL